ncbi:MAG: hypothetical protein IJJ26_08275 [Victivallales bacterium]|nr:hypothetical protein [Victivallales bacterium]
MELNARGLDGDKYNMNAFDTVLGLATATKDYVYRFYSRDDLDDIIEDPTEATPTTPRRRTGILLREQR